MNGKITSLLAMLLFACNATAADDAQIQRGKYLATAGDCVACHSLPGAKPFAGGLALPTPIGEIIATNITPSKTAGIGNYSLEEFSDALRKGIRADGKRLYPAMPYTSYAKVNDEDIKAMYAYFMNAVEPVDTPAKPTALPFPFNIRFSMAAWNLLFLDNKVYQPDTARDAEWNRGAYLVQGLTHCSTCHSPRNLMMAEVSSKALAGGDVGTWHAPNITSDGNSGIGGWEVAELVAYLKTGEANDKAQAAGPMAEAVDHSLQYLDDSDLKAIAVYLKTVPAQQDAKDAKPVHALGQKTDELASIRGVALPADGDKMTGAQLYDAECASCHQAQGEGSVDGGLPSLANNTAVGRSNTQNLVMVILEGVKRGADGQDIRMQGFASRLSDQQVATLATYLTAHYGNPEVKVGAAQVKELRAGGPKSHLAALAQGAIAVGVLVVLGLLIWWLRRNGRS
ncbi:c-type cytochrome [Pseudomonas putida]